MKKILIMRTEHIGDYVASIPAIKTLKKSFPRSEITLVVGPWNKSLAEATLYIDKVIIFDNPFVKRDLNKLDLIKIFTLKIGKLISFFKKIRKENYDLLVIFSNRKYNKLFLRFIKSKKKICGIGLDLETKHEKFRCFEVLKSLNLKKEYKNAEINVSEKDKKMIQEFIKKNGWKKKKLIVVHTVAPVRRKIWPLDNWAKLINEVNKKKNDYVFLFVGTKEYKEELNEAIKKINKKNIFNIAGKLSLTQLYYLLKKSYMFMGINSGPIQLAILDQKPILSLFGIERAVRWGPLEKGDKFFKKDNIADIKVKDVLGGFKICEKNAKKKYQ